MHCTNCGAALASSAKFCRACGHADAEPVSFHRPAAGAASAVRNASRPSTTLVLACAAGAAVLLGAGYMASTKTGLDFEQIFGPQQADKPSVRKGTRWVFDVKTSHIGTNPPPDHFAQYEENVIDVREDAYDFERTTLATSSGTVGFKTTATIDRSTGGYTALSGRTVVRGKQVLYAYPLFPGKTWTYETTRKVGTAEREDKVASKAETWETVEVPAGKFRAIKVTSAGTFTYTAADGRVSTGTHRTTNWYAPEVSRSVKFVHWSSSFPPASFGGETQWTLVKLDLK